MPVICDQVPSNRHQTVFIGLALYYKKRGGKPCTAFLLIGECECSYVSSYFTTTFLPLMM